MSVESIDKVSLPQFGSYGRYAGGNYGLHCLWFSLGPLTVYFSYQTIVAFSTPVSGLVVSENIWSKTTGKHLGWIDSGEKSKRIPYPEFRHRLAEVLAGFSV